MTVTMLITEASVEKKADMRADSLPPEVYILMKET